MRGRISKGFLIVVALAFGAGVPALAQDGGDSSGGEKQEPKKKAKKGWGSSSEDPEDQWKTQYKMGERFSKYLTAARTALIAEQFDETEQILTKKIRIHRLNPLEKAHFYRTYAFVEYGRENLDGARNYLEQSIEQEALSKSDVTTMRYQIAQMYLQEQNWPKAAEQLELWFTMETKPNASAFNTLALTYYQMDEFEKALEPATTAVEMAEEPRESWIQLLLALRLTRKEYVEAVPLLEQLVELYPKKNYWLQLSTVYGALERYKESLVLLQLAYTQDLLDEDAELRRLAEMMLFLELPYRAAQVMEKGLDDELIDPDSEAYELLSNSRIASRNFEDAVAPLEKAAELSTGGELYIRLAQVHLQREDWEGAAKSLRQALDKGDLESEGDAQLLMGITFYSQKQPKQALTWFGRASQHKETAAEANTWLRYIERELQSG